MPLVGTDGWGAVGSLSVSLFLEASRTEGKPRAGLGIRKLTQFMTQDCDQERSGGPTTVEPTGT